jgi:hypothetical protein
MQAENNSLKLEGTLWTGQGRPKSQSKNLNTFANQPTYAYLELCNIMAKRTRTNGGKSWDCSLIVWRWRNIFCLLCLYTVKGLPSWLYHKEPSTQVFPEHNNPFIYWGNAIVLLACILVGSLLVLNLPYWGFAPIYYLILILRGFMPYLVRGGEWESNVTWLGQEKEPWRQRFN